MLVANTEGQAGMSDSRPSHFAFISYLRCDLEAVDSIRNRLEANGIATWMDKQGIEAGANWVTLIERKITDADAFILFLSSSLEDRPDSYVHKEIDLAVEKLRNTHPAIKWIYLIRLDECNIPDKEVDPDRKLSDYHAIDAFPSTDSAVEIISRQIKGEWENPEANGCKVSFRFSGIAGGLPSIMVVDLNEKHDAWGFNDELSGDVYACELFVLPGKKQVIALVEYVQTSIETGVDRLVTRQSNIVEALALPKGALAFSVRKSRRTGFLGLKTESGEWLTLELVSSS